MKNTLISTLQQIIKDELLQGRRQLQDFLNPLLFFIIVVFMFPLTTDASTVQLQTLAPGAIWVAALLATLLSLDRLFQVDFQNGTLEQLLLSPYPLPCLVSAKIFAHWLLTGLPLIAITPLLGILLDLPVHTIKIVLISLTLGTPTLSLVGAMITALVVGLRYGNFLLPLLTMPLLIPVLIFGANCMTASGTQLPIQSQLALLGAFLLLSLALAPFATASALRIGMNNR